MNKISIFIIISHVLFFLPASAQTESTVDGRLQQLEQSLTYLRQYLNTNPDVLIDNEGEFSRILGDIESRISMMQNSVYATVATDTTALAMAETASLVESAAQMADQSSAATVDTHSAHAAASVESYATTDESGSLTRLTFDSHGNVVDDAHTATEATHSTDMQAEVTAEATTDAAEATAEASTQEEAYTPDPMLYLQLGAFENAEAAQARGMEISDSASGEVQYEVNVLVRVKPEDGLTRLYLGPFVKRAHLDTWREWLLDTLTVDSFPVATLPASE